MPQMVDIKEASKATGLSKWEIGRGARAGDYPCIRIGEGRGKFLFNIDLLCETLKKRALANVKNDPSNEVQPGIRRVD